MPRLRPTAPLSAGLASLALALGLTACGSSDPAAERGSGQGGGSLELVAAFYPLQWAAEQVGGDDVSVASLTSPGTEPHDLELSPKQVAEVQDADLVLKVSGFQPAVDDATEGRRDRTFDAAEATALDLELPAGGDEEGTDPHFWLDPTKLAEVTIALGDRLAEVDPDHADAYRSRAAATADRLDDLDAQFRAGLADCDATDLVTSHTAFGYLARRYGLEQLGISGVDPSQEPSPKQLAAVADFVEEHDVRTIYFETLVPDDLARTVADETGAVTAVLDPIEGVTDESAGSDYPSIMEANLSALRAGQGCR